VDCGDILTSAGVTSSIDLCIHLVRSDHGDPVASATARQLVMSPHRLGGQAQFVQRDTLLAGTGGLAHTLQWLEASLERPITLRDIARHAGTSQRTVTRHFTDQTGSPPLRWLLSVRIDRAKDLLSTTDLTIEGIARRCGFVTGTTFRHHFTRIAGLSPRQYRRSFRSGEGCFGQGVGIATADK
jgi:transcriptional regulator GlxA family with amidase domain